MIQQTQSLLTENELIVDGKIYDDSDDIYK